MDDLHARIFGDDDSDDDDDAGGAQPTTSDERVKALLSASEAPASRKRKKNKSGGGADAGRAAQILGMWRIAFYCIMAYNYSTLAHYPLDLELTGQRGAIDRMFAYDHFEWVQAPAILGRCVRRY